MVDGASCANSYMLAVADDCRRELRETLAGHEGFLRDDHLWLLRLGELTASLPLHFSRIRPEAATSLHHVLVLVGDRRAHFAGVREALRIALARYETDKG